MVEGGKARHSEGGMLPSGRTAWSAKEGHRHERNRGGCRKRINHAPHLMAGRLARSTPRRKMFAVVSYEIVGRFPQAAFRARNDAFGLFGRAGRYHLESIPPAERLQRHNAHCAVRPSRAAVIVNDGTVSTVNTVMPIHAAPNADMIASRQSGTSFRVAALLFGLLRQLYPKNA